MIIILFDTQEVSKSARADYRYIVFNCIYSTMKNNFEVSRLYNNAIVVKRLFQLYRQYTRCANTIETHRGRTENGGRMRESGK